jgi:hypothetical protein
VSGNSAGSDNDAPAPRKFYEIYTSRLWGVLIFAATFIIVGSLATAIRMAFPDSETSIFIQKNFDAILGITVGIVALGMLVRGFVPSSDR